MKAVKGEPPLTSKGKPEVLYFGAEWCPFCATERWPLAVALSRFGTLAGPRQVSSASNDTYPNTATISFGKATYTSKYLTLTPVETADVNHKQLMTPIKAQDALVSKPDGPPYFDKASAGAIPFIDYGNTFISSGASYDPQLLQGQTHAQIAAGLSKSDNKQGQAIRASANVINPALCTLTDGQPGSVRKASSITSIQGKLGAG